MIPKFSGLLLAATTLLTTTSAHSWIEQMAVIGTNGQYVGAYGYPRGYVARTDPGFTGESDKYILPSASSGRLRINDADLACHPSQRTTNQPAKWPRLEVAPGSAIAMKYLENGHVTLPENQPGKPAPSRGTVYVFGTTNPLPDEKLATILKWSPDGSGGDKRGRLLGANNYDDKRCHQINGGPLSTQRQASNPDPITGQPGSHSELWCETDIVLPKDLPVGKPLTIYWVWDWPTAPGTPGVPEGKDEYYTTCADLDVVAQPPVGTLSQLLPQQDPNTHAVADYAHRPAQAPLPRGQKPVVHNAPPTPPKPTKAPAPPAPSAPVPVQPFGFVTSAKPPVPSVAPPSPGKVRVSTMLAPGQGLLVGKNGQIFTYDLPTDGGMAAGPGGKPKQERGILEEDVKAEVGGGHRFRMPRVGT